jgi:hypothetical protein
MRHVERKKAPAEAGAFRASSGPDERGRLPLAGAAPEGRESSEVVT